VVVLSGGRVVEEGAPERLLESQGAFAELMGRQQWVVAS
jgi:ABC-type multidrug transport system fused ATPase/permease subunit